MSDNDPPAPKGGRREFLEYAVTGVMGCVGVATGYPVYHFLSPEAPPDIVSVVVGNVEDFEPGTSRRAVLANVPVLVIRLPDNTIRAFEAHCTHLNCVVRYEGGEGGIACACHGGRYAVDGSETSGPPPRPLTQLAVDTSDGVVVVSKA